MTRKVFRRGRDGSSPVSEQNSSTTLLTAVGEFAGASDDINDYASVAVSVYTDVASSFEGLVLECSTDDTLWLPMAKLSVPAGEIFTYETNLSVRYFRVRYLSGGTQTAFSLQTIYRERPATPRETTLALEIADALYTDVHNESLQALNEIAFLLRLNNAYLERLVGERLFNHDLHNDSEI